MTLCVVSAYWFSEKTKLKVGYHFRKNSKPESRPFSEKVDEVD